MAVATSRILEIYSGTRVVSLYRSKNIVTCSLKKLQFRGCTTAENVVCVGVVTFMRGGMD
jgi:hypothetical protein